MQDNKCRALHKRLHGRLYREKDSKEEEVSTEQKESDEVSDKQEDSNTTNQNQQTDSGNSNANANSSSNSNSNPSSSNNGAVSGNTPSVSTTPPATTTTPSVPQEPLTEWEKLGISEYEYYNAKLFDWEEVASTDINECISDASRINNTYGFVTNYGYVSGKYVNTVGCWVTVNVNGIEYYLNEFENLGYN